MKIITVSRCKALKKLFGSHCARRLAAFAFSLVLCFQLLPVTTWAAEDTTLNWQSFGRGNSPVSEGSQMTNTYIMEVSSGSRLGGGAAENVLYFIVSYTTEDGVAHSEVISPAEEGFGKGFAKAAEIGNRNDRRAVVETNFGYRIAEPDAGKALSSVRTDQMMFETPAPIRSIDKLQIFGRKADGFSDWSCQGMRFYRVDKIYGLELYGWYSDMGYIDFSGELIAEVLLGDGGNFRWNNSAGMFTIAGYGEEDGLSGVDLVCTATKDQYTARYPDIHVGEKHETQAGNRVMIRIDLADAAGAGFESLAGSFASGSKTKISTLKLCECAALTVRYKDVYDCVREVSLPLIINAVGQAMETLGDVAVAGYAQQGDSIALSAMLPDFKEFAGASLACGETNAREATNMTLTDAAMKNPTHSERRAKAGTDEINYTCIAVYRDVAASVALDGATIRYHYEAGKNNPTDFAASTSVSGTTLQSNRTTPLTMQKYRNNLVLQPVDRTERYLVTVSTDNVGNAGTGSDVILKFKYTDLSGREMESTAFNIRDYVRQFYGEWPGNVGDFAYRYGLRDGGTVQFILPLQNVNKFTSVSVKISGDDDWQYSGISLAMVKRCENRVASWEEINANGLQSHLRYTRRVDTEQVCFSVGRTFDPEEEREMQPAPDGQGETGGQENLSGRLVQDDREFHEYDGKSREVSSKEDVDWSEIRHYMTFDQARGNLGFTKERCRYKIDVHVAGDKVNADDDDCGSKNLFYFRLVFENGVSGFTLANQQIMGDAFRTGAITTFKVSTSQDYGELTAIQVIPDNQDGNGDVYDKLKIKKIVVTQETNSPISPMWAAAGSGDEGLGWLGIDYRDPGEFTTNKGAQGRSVFELATTYEVTESTLSVKLLIGITTGSYGEALGKDENGNTVKTAQDTLSGGMCIGYRYINGNGETREVQPTIDVIELMNQYSARAGVKKRTVDGVTEDVSYYVSDPTYQFRAGKTDYFFLTVDDVQQLLDISLVIRSNVVTTWNITGINVYMVKGEGVRYINKNDEYDYRYDEGEGPELVAEWNREEPLEKPVTVFRTLQNNGIATIDNIPFKENHIELTRDAGAWSSVITREPQSQTDTLNLYLYPGTGEGTMDTNSYGMIAAIMYHDTMTMLPSQISAGTLNRGEDKNGRPVFYATGLSVSNMGSMDGVEVKTDSIRTDWTAPITYGVLQRVRNGVLIDAYRLYGCADAHLGTTLGVDSDAEKNSMQRVLIQVSDSAETQQLITESHDLAVALNFRTDDLSGSELRSKFAYLTDQGYTSVSGGQVLELDYLLGDISELTGVNLVATGGLDLPISAVFLADEANDHTISGTWGVGGEIFPTVKRAYYPATEKVGALTLRLKTAAGAESALSTGQTVRMTVGYFDEYGVLSTQVFDDIRGSIVSGRGFAAGETDVVRVLIPGMSELRWIELEPWSKATDTQASWTIEQLSAETDLSNEVGKTINQTVVQGTPLNVVLAEIQVAGTVYHLVTEKKSDTAGANDAVGTEVYTGKTLPVVTASGDGVKINARTSGTLEGCTATVSAYDPVTGATGYASMDSTHRYTEEKLAEIIENAEKVIVSGETPDLTSADGSFTYSEHVAQAIAEEVAAAKSVLDYAKAMQNAAGRLIEEGGTFIFYAPRNYTGEAMHYRIVVASKEAPSAAFTVDMTVKSELDLLTEAISALKTAQTNTLLMKQAEASAEAARLAEEAKREAEAARAATQATSWGNGG